jgi:hypothetical protein
MWRCPGIIFGTLTFWPKYPAIVLVPLKDCKRFSGFPGCQHLNICFNCLFMFNSMSLAEFVAYPFHFNSRYHFPLFSSALRTVRSSPWSPGRHQLSAEFRLSQPGGCGQCRRFALCHVPWFKGRWKAGCWGQASGALWSQWSHGEQSKSVDFRSSLGTLDRG